MAHVYTMFTSIKMDKKSTMVLTSVTKTIRIKPATATQHQTKYTRLPSNIISKAEEMLDVQKRDGHCKVRKGQRSNACMLAKMMMMSTYMQQSFITSQYFLSESRNYPRFSKTEG